MFQQKMCSSNPNCSDPSEGCYVLHCLLQVLWLPASEFASGCGVGHSSGILCMPRLTRIHLFADAPIVEAPRARTVHTTRHHMKIDQVLKRLHAGS
jgi:hypothetical protein